MTGAAPAAAIVLTLTAAAEPIVRASAGIRIVGHRIDPAAVPVFAVVDSVPDLLIAEEGRGDAYLFSRITDAPTLDGGALAVLENQSSEIRIFDGAGEHLRTFGGSGDGPGEFEALSSAAGVSGDADLSGRRPTPARYPPMETPKRKVMRSASLRFG